MTQNNLVHRGIANQKKAKLDMLTEQLKQAQCEFDQQQNIVSALQEKLATFQGFLSDAETQKATALLNLNLGKDVLSNVSSLNASADLANKQVDAATGIGEKSGICYVSSQMAELTNKLILSVELINKLTGITNQQKANNQLIPDTLIAALTNATADAQNAVATTLTALQSCYVAEMTLLDSQSTISLCAKQATELHRKMARGWDSHTDTCTDKLTFNFADESSGILALLYSANQRAIKNYEQALHDSNNVTKQLASAQALLVVTTNSLAAYQAGLAAATAAATAA